MALAAGLYLVSQSSMLKVGLHTFTHISGHHQKVNHEGHSQSGSTARVNIYPALGSAGGGLCWLRVWSGSLAWLFFFLLKIFS